MLYITVFELYNTFMRIGEGIFHSHTSIKLEQQIKQDRLPIQEHKSLRGREGLKQLIVMFDFLELTGR